MKKIIAIMLSFALMFSLVACSNDSSKETTTPSNSETNTDSEEPVVTEAAKTDSVASTEKIHLVAAKLGFTEEQITLEKENAAAKGEELSAGAKFYIGVTEKIAQDYPNYEMEYVDWGWAETLDQKQRASILAGDAPSLVAGETFMPVYASSGMLEPLPQDIIDAVDPSFLINNKEGVPVAVAYKSSIFMLFYNKTLMKNAGLDPESPPKTWDEWKEMSRIITEKGDGKVFGGGVPSFPHAGGSLRATPFFRQLGIDFGGGSTINITDPKVMQTLQFIRDMNAYLPAGLGNSADEGPLWTEFQEKQTVAFAVNGSWQASALKSNGIDWGVTELPLPEGGVTGNCMVGAVYVGVPITAENKEDCFNLIRVLIDPELQKNWLDDTIPSPLKQYIESDAEYADNTTLKVATTALKNGIYSGLTTFDKNDAQIWEIINTKVLARTTMTEDSINDICSEAQAEIENLLK